MPHTFLIHECLGQAFLRSFDLTSFTFGDINSARFACSSTEGSAFLDKKKVKLSSYGVQSNGSNGNQKCFMTF